MPQTWSIASGPKYHIVYHVCKREQLQFGRQFLRQPRSSMQYVLRTAEATHLTRIACPANLLRNSVITWPAIHTEQN